MLPETIALEKSLGQALELDVRLVVARDALVPARLTPAPKDSGP